MLVLPAIADVVGLAHGAMTEHFPSKPIRLIVPVSAGGGADFVARAYAARLSVAFGQQVVVDNRGGAAGIIAMEAAAKAAPDGYTLLLATAGQIVINPYISSVQRSRV